MSDNLNGQSEQIEARAFVPSAADDKGVKLQPWHVVVGTFALLSVFIFWFLFTSKSVQLNFSPAPHSVNIEGGFSFELGGIWLLREGTYKITAEANLHEPMAQEIKVGNARNQSIDLVFTPLPGYLDIELTPADAIVRIDDEIYENGSQLSAGEHEIAATHPRYLPYSGQIEIEGKQIRQSTTIALAPNWADVTVTSKPAGARVFIDEEDQGVVTPAVVEALAGEREIRVELPGHKIHRERIFAQAGMPMELMPIALSQADAQARIASSPSGAGILLDGNFVGRTPSTIDLKSGQSYQVQLVQGGYRSYRRNVRPASGEVLQINATLARETGEVSIEVEPKTARLTLNGKAQGAAAAGTWLLNLPISEQTVQLSLDGYASYTQKIVPKSGLTQAIKVKLLTIEEARLAAMKPSIQAPDGQSLKLMQPTDFAMGASRREPGRRANETLRDVNMERLFYIATHETTNAQFRKFATGHDSGKYVETTLNEDDQPVVNLSWHDAAAYCNWLSEQADLPPYYEIEFGKVVGVFKGSIGYRLPTEAEWAWSARTIPGEAEPLRFPWGNQLPPPDRHGNYADRSASNLVGRVIFGYNDNYAAASPIGIFKPNQHGIYDLGGNVSEWINDFYEIPKNDTVKDPTGPVSAEYHVIRGSSWMHGTITELRLSFRDYGIDGRQDVGFRIARYVE